MPDTARRLGAAALALLAGAAALGCVDSRPRDAEFYRQALHADVPKAPPPVVEKVGPTEAAAAGRPPAALPQAVQALLDQDQLALADCFLVAVACNERLAVAGESLLQTVLRRDQALSAVLPRLSATANAFQQEALEKGVGGSSPPRPDHRDFSIQLKQPLFHGLKEFAALRQTGHQGEAAREALRDEERAVYLVVAQAFYSVLLAEAQIKALETTVHVEEERLREVRARQQNGLARRTEVLAIETQLAQDQASLEQARNAVAIARSRLGVVVGCPVVKPLADTDVVPTVPEDPAPLIEEALDHRPDLKKLVHDADAAEDGVAVQRGDLWPALDLTGNWYAWRDGYPETQKETHWDVTAALSYPFFEGGLTRARIREAESLLRQARLRLATRLREVGGEVREAYLNLQSDAKLYERYEAGLRLADENYRLVQEEYRQGLAANLEVLTAHNQLERARLDVERQRYQRRLDGTQLDVVVGRKPGPTQ